MPFWHIYPDLDKPQPHRSAAFLERQRRKMTDAEVLAAHTVYMRARLTRKQIAEMIWERYGYANASAAHKSLIIAFQRLGLPSRRCGRPTRSGEPCQGHPGTGIDTCLEHSDRLVRPSQMAGPLVRQWTIEHTWQPDEQFLADVKRMHIDEGLPFQTVARLLLGRTTITSVGHLSRRLRDIARAEGWHLTQHQWPARRERQAA